MRSYTSFSRAPNPFASAASSLLCRRFAIAVAALAFAPMASAQLKYRVVVPEVQGQPITTVQARGNQINEGGQTLLNRSTSFAIWQDNQPLRIVNARSDANPLLTRVSATTINAKQQVVGSKTYLDNSGGRSVYQTRPFYWDAAHGVVDLSELSVLDGATTGVTSMVDLNDTGIAIGATEVFDADGNSLGAKAFLWDQNHGIQSIPPAYALGKTSATFPQALNNDGQAVGIYHRFTTSTSSYYERGFLYEAGETVALDQRYPDFFDSFNFTARDINNTGAVVGERDRFAYLFDTKSEIGYTIKGFGRNSDGMSAGARAYSVNDHGVVAGLADVYNAEGRIGAAPLLWSKETGSVNLYDLIKSLPSEYLPSSLSPMDCVIVPKSINCRGQISAQLYSTSSKSNYSREIVLQPVLDLNWHEMIQTQENGVNGVLYRFDKSRLPAETLPLNLFQLEVSFQYSADLRVWDDLQDGDRGVRILNSDDVIELFVPLRREPIFVSVRLSNATPDAATFQ